MRYWLYFFQQLNITLLDDDSFFKCFGSKAPLVVRKFAKITSSECNAIEMQWNATGWRWVNTRHTRNKCAPVITCNSAETHSSFSGISLTLVYSSTNISKSVWTSGFWKPLVHKNMSNFWNNIFHKFSIPKSRRALDPSCIRASLCSPARTLYAQGVDEWTLVGTSDFSEPLVHNTSA